jgi:hypothetical protein
MAGIIATLKPDNTICVLCEQVDNLSLTLVTPLGADNYNTGHEKLLIKANYKKKG